MKRNPKNYTKYIVATVGIVFAFVAYEYTHLWLLSGMGFALALASYIQG